MNDEGLKIWLSFGKFLLCAGGIGLVSTIINWQIQQQELQVNLRNAEIQYLDRFSKGALHEDLYKRRNFAQYFATVTISNESRSRWNEYLNLINAEIEISKSTILAKSERLVEKTNKTSAEEENRRNLKKRLDEAKEIEEQTTLKRELELSQIKLAALTESLLFERDELKRLKSDISSLDDAVIRGNYTIPKVFVGTWEGEGHQDGQTWTMKLSIDEQSVSIEYPSLSCGGIWQPIDLRNPGQLQFRENIQYGLGECINFGSVVLSRTNDNEMEFNWYYPSGTFGAKGKLSKKAED